MNIFLYVGLYLLGIIITGFILYNWQSKEVKELNRGFKIPLYEVDFQNLFIKSLFFLVTWLYLAFIMIIVGFSKMFKKGEQ